AALPEVLIARLTVPTEASQKLSHNPTEGSLWLGVLGGPVLWFAQMECKYALVSTICPMGNQIVLHAISVVSLLLAASIAFVSWRNWSSIRNVDPNETRRVSGRVHFMAVSGFFLSCMFVMVILAQEIPNLFLSPCLPGIITL